MHHDNGKPWVILGRKEKDLTGSLNSLNSLNCLNRSNDWEKDSLTAEDVLENILQQGFCF